MGSGLRSSGGWAAKERNNLARERLARGRSARENAGIPPGKRAAKVGLNGETGLAISQESKSTLAHTHFSRLIGTPSIRSKALNWNELGYTQHDLDDLGAPFTEQEIEAVIKEMPSEKAPGPDGFIRLFYKQCWSIIKHDLVEAIMGFYNHRTAKLGLINAANIVLLPKTSGASSLSDYRPISLINSVTKIITKILTNRLAPHMNSLVSNAQNAFIKKRCIHDNFIYAQRVIQLLHKEKETGPLHKT
jgi:hypothetical protein